MLGTPGSTKTLPIWNPGAREIGSYPYFKRGDFGVTIVLRGTEKARLAAAVEELNALIRALGGDPQEGLSEA